MEYASYLAGEKWSDHPACTHPLLGELARQINDFIADGTRQTFVEVVPDLIGLTSSDLRFDLHIALGVARTALPFVAESRQHMMAAAVLTCERLLADLDGRAGAPMSQESQDALDRAPQAAAWARRFTSNMAISHRAFRRTAAPTIVRYAVQGVAHACIPDPDSVLRDLLIDVVADLKKLRASEPGGRRFSRVRAATSAPSESAPAAAAVPSQIAGGEPVGQGSWAVPS
jgi:hypothetical protein